MKHPILKLIDAFVDVWPDAEYGKGHIVLSDYNLTNENIMFVIQELEKDLDRPDLPTAAFMLVLSLIPEEQRLQAMNEYWNIQEEESETLWDDQAEEVTERMMEEAKRRGWIE